METKKIQTALEFFQTGNFINIQDAMIAYAKFHVQACKRDIVNNVETCIGGDGSPLVSITSILNSYPLDNIK